MFTGVKRCLQEKKHLVPSRSVATLSGVALSPLGGKKLDFALQMKNTADDISLVVQRTIHNKIQIIADFAKTSQTRR